MRAIKKPILDRYERTEDGRIIIDITTAKIEDLFSNFDKTSPYGRKDLDPEFAEYLIECAKEIGKAPFIVRLNYMSAPGAEAVDRAEKGINNFFIYLRELEFRKARKMIKTSIILLGVGLAILILSIFVHQSIENYKSILYTVFAEGLTVAAWVSMWEALANFLVEWPPSRQNIRTYRRIAESSVLSRHQPPEGKGLRPDQAAGLVENLDNR